MTLQELKAEATRLKEDQDFKEALPLYIKIWDLERNEWNGYRLAQCHRKIGNFDDAKEIYDFFETNFPTFKPILNEKLWLTYTEKIKDWENSNLIEDAEILLSQTNQYDKYTGSIFIKTVIRVSRHFRSTGEHEKAFQWLLKLDQSVIANTVFTYHGTTYPADRKVYFILFADALFNLNKHIEYLEKCLITLNFEGVKHTQFLKHIIESITFENYVSRVKLAQFIKSFQEEIHLRKKQDFRFIYNDKKVLLISDLSHYLFCPVSYAINESFEIIANTSWEKDEWLREKKYLNDRHRTFQKNKSYDDSFSDTEITIDEKLKSDFNSILNSKLLVNNATNPNPTVYSNSSNSLRGAPDYVMQHQQGFKFAISEKFSAINSADSGKPFESDLIKQYAFLDELKTLDLKFGYFLTWYWQLQDVETNENQIKKKIVITSYRLFKVDPSQENSRKLKRTIELVTSFKKTKTMDIDGNQISYANKCLHCSVISYCNHKTGKLNRISLPYNLSELKLKGEPTIYFNSTNDSTDNDTTDLPF